MIRWSASAVAALLCWSAPAAAQPDNADCWEDANRAPCLQASADELVRTYGVRRIESHRDAGDQVVRVSYWHNRDVVLIAFVRAPGREPKAIVSFPHRQDQPVPAVMEATIPQAVWGEALGRAVYAARALVPLPPRQSTGQTICIHPTVYLFEASDPAVPEYGMPAQIRRHSATTCDDAPLLQFAMDFQRLAVSLFPACDALDHAAYGDTYTRFVTCRRLSGDRLTAARIMNLAAAFRSVNDAGDMRDVRARIGADAVIDWPGRRRGTGERPAAF